MQKIVMFAIASLGILIIGSCTATVKRATSNSNIRLRDYNKVVVNLISGSGNVERGTRISGSLQNDEIINIGVGTPDKKAFQLLQYLLIDIGFQVVTDTAGANAIVDFSLGTVKYDSIYGWITNESFLFFKDGKTGELLEGFNAKGDPMWGAEWYTLDQIISEIGKSLRSAY